MSINEQDARALAYLARRLREETRGAKTWDELGCLSVLSKHVGADLALIAERVIRHATDVQAQTPGAINRPFSPAAPSEAAPRPPRPDEACRLCGRALHPPDAVCDQPTTRPASPAPAAVVAEQVAKLRALRNQPESEDT